jgi:hypothetical protein
MVEDAMVAIAASSLFGLAARKRARAAGRV